MSDTCTIILSCRCVHHSAHCHVYAIVKETRIGRTETICGNSVSLRPTPSSTEPETNLSNGGERRERQVYLSTGHVVEIRFMTSGKTGHYLMKYDGTYYWISSVAPSINRRLKDGMMLSVACAQRGAARRRIYRV